MNTISSALGLVGILFGLVNQVDCTKSVSLYGGISQGFVTAFKRNQPLVLLRTALGIQILNGNQTCYDNQASLYYPSEFQIKYADYSTKDNYLVYVGLDRVCFKNLFKSDWNNAIQRDILAECRTLDLGSLYGISIIHRIVFIVHEDIVSLISLNNPMCKVEIIQKNNSVQNIMALHITNFNSGEDLILVGNEVLIRVYSLAGESSYNYTLEGTDRLKDISSDIDGNFFMVVNRDSVMVVLKFPKKFEKSKSVTFLKLPKHNFMSISVSKSLVAVLSSFENSSNSYWLHLKPKSNKSIQTVYNCLAGPDLLGVLVVEEREQVDRFYCEVNPDACSKFGDGEYCNSKLLFGTKYPLHLDDTNVQSELIRKLILTVLLAVSCFIVVAFFQIQNNT